MVLKGVRAGLGLLLSVSAPSAPAVRKAKELGITLAGFSRGAQVNIYTHPHRITLNGQPLAPPE
jgi:FdhD protein